MKSMWNSDELRSQGSWKPTETCWIKSIIFKNTIFFNYCYFLDKVKPKPMKNIHAVILAENVKFNYKELWVRMKLTLIKAATHLRVFARVEECYVYFKERCLINSTRVVTLKCCLFLLMLLTHNQCCQWSAVSYPQTFAFLVSFMTTFKITKRKFIVCDQETKYIFTQLTDLFGYQITKDLFSLAPCSSNWSFKLYTI